MHGGEVLQDGEISTVVVCSVLLAIFAESYRGFADTTAQNADECCSELNACISKSQFSHILCSSMQDALQSGKLLTLHHTAGPAGASSNLSSLHWRPTVSCCREESARGVLHAAGQRQLLFAGRL